MEKEVGEGSGTVRTSVVSSLSFREQVLVYGRDRQLVLNRACEGKFYIFHGVDII